MPVIDDTLGAVDKRKLIADLKEMDDAFDGFPPAMRRAINEAADAHIGRLCAKIEAGDEPSVMIGAAVLSRLTKAMITSGAGTVT